jgi:hypothetical protein
MVFRRARMATKNWPCCSGDVAALKAVSVSPFKFRYCGGQNFSRESTSAPLSTPNGKLGQNVCCWRATMKA